MSTILKALKKLEDEKRAAAPVNFSARIVAAPTAARRSSHGVALIAAGAFGGLLLAVAVICGWFWLRSAEPEGGPSQVIPSAQSGPPALAALPAPVSEPPARNAQVPVAGASRRSAGNAAKPPPAAAPAPSQARLTVTPPPQPQPLPPPPGQSVPPRRAAATPPRHDASPAEVLVTDRQIPPPGQQWSAPHLEVTDIFPPSAGSGWMAVVNGLPVMEGTMVADAVVEEIRADRVMFLIQGKVVTVPLSNKR